MAPLIELKNVQLTLSSVAGKVDILRDINFALNQGEQVAILGPSGAGKSSLLLLMAGLERLTAGEIFFRGHQFNSLNEDQLAHLRRDFIGIVFQAFHLIPTMTAIENVALPLELANRRNAFNLSKELLNQVGLGQRLTHYPSQLSGGEQQRVALARALVMSPPLILADEPTGNLDVQTGKMVMDLLLSLCLENQTALVLITHDLLLAERFSRQVHLLDGCIVSDQTRQYIPDVQMA